MNNDLPSIEMCPLRRRFTFPSNKGVSGVIASPAESGIYLVMLNVFCSPFGAVCISFDVIKKDLAVSSSFSFVVESAQKKYSFRTLSQQYGVL